MCRAKTGAFRRFDAPGVIFGVENVLFLQRFRNSACPPTKAAPCPEGADAGRCRYSGPSPDHSRPVLSYGGAQSSATGPRGNAAGPPTGACTMYGRVTPGCVRLPYLGARSARHSGSLTPAGEGPSKDKGQGGVGQVRERGVRQGNAGRSAVTLPRGSPPHAGQGSSKNDGLRGGPGKGTGYLPGRVGRPLRLRLRLPGPP